MKDGKNPGLNNFSVKEMRILFVKKQNFRIYFQ